MQMLLPWATSLDVAYTGRHNYNAQVGGQDFPINLNTIDFGTAFNPALQDPSIAPSAIAGRDLARRAESQSGARVSRLRQHHLPAVPTAGGRSTRSSSRSTAGSGTASSSG